MREAINAVRSRQPVNLAIVIINVVVYIVLCILGDPGNAVFMLTHGAGYTPAIVDLGQYYRLFTSMFLHFSVQHLFGNMLILFFLGDALERYGGKIRFLIIYLGGGLVGNLLSVGWDLYTGDFAVSAGASGAIFAVTGALLALVLINRKQVSGDFVRRMILMAVLSVLEGLTTAGVDNSAHIGGLVCGFLLAMLFHKKLTFDRKVPIEDFEG